MSYEDLDLGETLVPAPKTEVPFDWLKCIRVTKTQQRYVLFPPSKDVSPTNLGELLLHTARFVSSPPGPVALHVAPLVQGTPFLISDPIDFPYSATRLREVLVSLTNQDPAWYTRAIMIFPLSEDRAAMLHRKLVL
jgi:hypothetical protein